VARKTGKSPTVATRCAAGSIDRVSQSAYESALDQLPPAYAQVLRLTDAEASDDEICDRLGIEPEGLETLVDLARRKLRRELTHG
jgi:DNA-directed RNA polymerase specialized sigma24 family protein